MNPRRIYERRALWAVGLVGVVGIGIATAANSWPALRGFGGTVSGQASNAETSKVADGSRLPLQTYVKSIKSDLFYAPQPPAPTTVVLKTETPKPAAPTPPPPPPDPLADFVYSGYVSVDGKRYALIENRKTREGKYVSAGDEFEGHTIASIEDRTLTLKLGESPRLLALNEDYKLVPLDKSADYLNPPGQTPGAPGAPGAPGGPGALPGGPGGPGGPFGPGGPMAGRFGRGRFGGPGGGMMFGGGGPGAPAPPNGPAGGAVTIQAAPAAATEASVQKIELDGGAITTDVIIK